MASTVWQNKVKEISRKVWTEHAKDEKFPEEYYTSLIRSELSSFSECTLLVIDGYKEEEYGADFEWWIKDKKDKLCGFRFQAKQLFFGDHRDHYYAHLEYPPTDPDKQRNDLISHAEANYLIPLYCFYNSFINTPFYTKASGIDQGEDGWTYCFAQKVRKIKMNIGLNLVNDSSYRDYRALSVIHPRSQSMSNFADTLSNYPKGILSSYFTMMDVSSEDIKKKYFKNSLPSYVYKKMNVRQKEIWNFNINRHQTNTIHEHSLPKFVVIMTTQEEF